MISTTVLTLKCLQSFKPVQQSPEKGMARKSSWLATGGPPVIPDWNPNLKEPWHFEFEREPVNDEKWSCIVTAAIQAEAQDEEFLQIYTQCVNTGLRKAVKIISMADVVKVLKETNSGNISKKEDENLRGGKVEKVEKPPRRNLKPSSPGSIKIVELAAKYATFTDLECKLPPDLMAAVLKYLIMNLKDQNCYQKRVDAVRNRKIRERNIKARFIRDLKPYEISQKENKSSRRVSPNLLESEEPINDEPIGGPDLYIMLTDFYDVFIFPEMLRMNVPFLALLKISSVATSISGKASHTSVPKPEAFVKKKVAITAFWEKLKDQCSALEKISQFKDIAMMQYHASWKHPESKQNSYRIIFDELTWMQYSAYCIYRQHQKYLEELYVQRLILSLEPLDLSKCEVYNKLCDALVTGEPLTPLLVLYAIVEQVVVGVPETESVALEYKPKFSDFFSNESESTAESDETANFVTPCMTCRNKQRQSPCEKLRRSSDHDWSSEKNEWTETFAENPPSSQSYKKANSQKSAGTIFLEPKISESIIDKVTSEKKSEKEIRKDKKWKTPSLCFYGDSVLIQTYHCDPRLLDSGTIIDRFLKNSDLPRIWSKYFELPPGERAFYNFHFFSLLKISKEPEELLKLKIFFTMSMKLIGITKSYLYRGEEENTSEMISGTVKEKLKKLSKVKFDKNAFTSLGGDEKDFSKYFFKTFIVDMNFRVPRRTIQIDNSEHVRGSSVKTDSQLLHKVKSQFSMLLVAHRSSGTYFPYCFRYLENAATTNSHCVYNEKILSTLYSLLDCFEISNLTELHFLNDKEEYLNLIQDFKFYEKLEPNLMIQRLLEAQESFNTIQCSYFAPTDTVIIIMHNDFDHRGIFYNSGYWALPTPVTLKDFYNYVYPEISDWLIDEDAEHAKFTAELEEKAKAEEEENDLKYLALLKRKYCEMSEENKKKFLETDVELQSEPEVAERELGALPVKVKPNHSNRISFVTTNLMDVRVENNKEVHEFHSQDGTEVKVTIETWLYSPLSLLTVEIKRSKLLLYYSHSLGHKEINTSFTLKTTSDIIFAFHKDDSENFNDFNYKVTISWPTGLLVEPIPHGPGIYVKQGYLKIYRRGWDIEEENSRCYLKTGQVLIFKENGDYDVLCASGTKYTFYESSVIPTFEIVSTTGEVWQLQTKGPCRNRKKLMATNKILIGFDQRSQETFYKREDGVYCMLWQSGRLVTNYPDGTKITSTPYFDEEEVTTEWTEEEKLYYAEFESKYKMEHSVQEPRSRTILRNSSGPKAETNYFVSEDFVSISCTYLMEHPKYSSVYFNPEDPYVRITLPDRLSILAHREGNYKVQQERNFLTVFGSTVEFYTDCCSCEDRSTVTFSFDSSEVLCKCVDFFQKTFVVLRDGSANLQECFKKSDEELSERSQSQQKSGTSLGKCMDDHNKHVALTQRCFAFERDLSGVEFLHADSFAFYCYQLPSDTHFDINTDDPDNINHTFSSPYYKIGYENWVMDYEDSENSLPTNLKKRDLKELGVKEISKNLFKYPFPQNHNCGDRQQKEKVSRKVTMPKLIMTRTVRCLPQEPDSVIRQLQKYVAAYQKKAHEIWMEYKNHKVANDRSQDSRYVKMRLKKIALTLNQSLRMYPHLCTLLPSTEKEIHYFGHFINSMDALKDHFQGQSDILPDCKQLPNPLPRSSDFFCIHEEGESQQNF